ncbi:MAG: DUF4390 domain-containing protein [Magnetococcus sp. MYC-9]
MTGETPSDICREASQRLPAVCLPLRTPWQKEKLAVGCSLLLMALCLDGCTPPEADHGGCQGAHLFTCRESKPLAQPGVIQQASLLPQRDKLYARAELDPQALKQLMELLDNGEPIWATYRFGLYRNHAWWPDLRISQVVLQRRLRLRLITRRYEMLDGQTGQIQYTSNPDEAMNFVGAPRYVPLGTLREKGAFLPIEHRYRLKVELTLEHEDMSYLFHLLDQWFGFGQSGLFHLQVPYPP